MVLDTEDDSKGNVLLLNFYDGKVHRTFYNPDPARVWLKKLKRPYTIWAVNLEYDMMNLFKDDLGEFPRRIWFGKSRLISYMFGKQLFYDTLNHWKISVAEMGKVVGRQKEPLRLDDADLMKKRCLSDCEITFAFTREMLKRYDALGARARSTLPSSSLDLFIKNYNRMNHKEIPTEETDFIKRGYFGGRTECFFIGTVDLHLNPDKKIVYADINSMYPSVMLNTFPYPYFTEGRADLNRMGITEALVQVDQEIPVLPIKHGGKLIFPNGRFWGVWTNAEINYARSLGGCRVKRIRRGIVYPVEIKPFDNFVTDLYERRRDERDKLMRDTYKLFMNSLYGKFGQGRVRKKVVPFEKYLENPERWTMENEPFIFDNRLVIFNEETEKYPKNAIMAWASYVTSYARIKLHGLISTVKEAGGIPLYCDTDSIMFSGSPGLLKGSSDLGDFKIEHILDRVDIKLPKFYRCYKEHEIVIERVKGVPASVARSFFDQNKATFQKPHKFFESMRRGVKMNEWKPVTKELRGVYDKGKVGKDGFVTPLEIFN